MISNVVARAARSGIAVLWMIGLPAAAAAEDTSVAPTAREAELAARIDRLVAQRATSSDLRLRILNTPGPEFERSGEEWIPTKPIRVDLYEQARGSTDPVVLDLLLMRCLPAMARSLGCDPVALAQRWVDVDTQNQFAWLALADAMRGAGRASEADATLERASLAPAWHEHIVDVGRLLSTVSPASGDLDEQAMVLVADLGNLYGSVLPSHGAQTLARFCKASDHRAACGRILATMTRDSDAISNLRLAAAFAARAGIDRSVAHGYQARADAVSAAIEIAPLPGDFALLDDGAKRTYLSAMRALLERGEVQFWRDKLIAAHLDERTAAARHVASLSAAEVQRRAERWQPTR